MVNLINSAAVCTVGQFVQCKYNNNLKVLVISGEPTAKELAEAWEAISAQYIEAAGVDIPEFAAMQEIHNLKVKKNGLTLLFHLQDVWIEKFAEPHVIGLEKLAKHNVKPVWRGDVADFVKQLDKAKDRNKSIDVQISEAEYSLDNIRIALGKEGVISDSRQDFRKLLIEVQRQGYKIDEDKTTVEDFGLMLRLIFEKNNAANMN